MLNLFDFKKLSHSHKVNSLLRVLFNSPTFCGAQFKYSLKTHEFIQCFLFGKPLLRYISFLLPSFLFDTVVIATMMLRGLTPFPIRDLRIKSSLCIHVHTSVCLMT